MAKFMLSGVDFNNSGGPLLYNHPSGLASDGTHFLLCDRFNNRVLIWNQLPTNWDQKPDLVLGQKDFTENNPGTGKHQLNWVGNVSAGSNGKVAVADTENDRILIWQQFPVSSGTAADVSIYLPDLTPAGSSMRWGWPWGVWTDGQKLAAVATLGGALLFWDKVPTQDNTAPDYVIQLPEFGTPRNISTDGSSYFFVGDHNAKVNGKPGTFFWNTYPSVANQPYNFYRDEWIKGQKTSGGQLYAAGLNSIFVWQQMPVSASQPPDQILSPPTYKNGDGVDLCIADGHLYVNNYNGNNVLIFNSLPNGPNASPSMSLSSPVVEAQTLDSMYYIQNPVPVIEGKRLIVSSDFDRAIYVWDQIPTVSGQAYDKKIALANNIHVWASTLYGNTYIVAGRNNVAIWNNSAALGSLPDRLFVNQIGNASFSDVKGVALDSQYFYLAEKDKIHVWKGIPMQSSANPVFSIQIAGAAFGFLHSNDEYLCAVQTEAPTRVYLFKTKQIADGNGIPYKVLSSSPQLPLFNQASHALVFGDALAVASRGNNQVLIWEALEEAGIPSKAIVLGQPDFNQKEAAIGANRLFMPSALWQHEGSLWVGEFKFSSRILKFTPGQSSDVNAVDLADGNLRIFPNPAGSEQITLEYCPTVARQGDIVLTDISGRRLRFFGQFNLSAQECLNTAIDLSGLNLNSGLYLLQVGGQALKVVSNR